MAAVSTRAPKPRPIHPVGIGKPVSGPPPTKVTYSFWVPEFVIHTTRAPEHDTDFATLGVAVMDAHGQQVAQFGPTTVSLGDLGDGPAALNMHVAGVSVPEGGSMNVAFTILNHGASNVANDIDEALNKFGSEILKALTSGGMKGGGSGSAGGSGSSGGSSGSGSGAGKGGGGIGILGLSSWEALLVEIAGPLVLEGIEALLADCDGLVVTDSLTLTQSDLVANTGNGVWSWSTEYKGTDSAVGCGANSDYTVSYAVMASPPCVTVPSVIGADPRKVASILKEVGLTGRERGSAKGNVDLPEVVEQDPAAGMIVLPSTVVEYEVRVPEGGPHPAP